MSLVDRDTDRTVRHQPRTHRIAVDNPGWNDAVHVDAVSWTALPSQ